MRLPVAVSRALRCCGGVGGDGASGPQNFLRGGGWRQLFVAGATTKIAGMNTGRFGVFLMVSVFAAACSDDGGGADGADTGGTTAASTGDSNPSTADDASADNPTTSGSAQGSTGGSTGMPMDSTGDDGATSSGTTAAEEESSGSSTGVQACIGMSFFATSEGSGKLGGNLGGLDGADETCQALAEAAGAGACTWHAYLSTADQDARDRIGAGPWENFNGDVIAADVAALHEDGVSNGEPQFVMDENGEPIPANEHDILTGSAEDGTLLDDASCADWTDASGDEQAGVGHSDIPGNPAFSPSWNAAHVVGGCTPGDLQSTNGAGRLYCFAL